VNLSAKTMMELPMARCGGATEGTNEARFGSPCGESMAVKSRRALRARLFHVQETRGSARSRGYDVIRGDMNREEIPNPSEGSIVTAEGG
jgi:hypothetical protein